MTSPTVLARIRNRKARFWHGWEHTLRLHQRWTLRIMQRSLHRRDNELQPDALVQEFTRHTEGRREWEAMITFTARPNWWSRLRRVRLRTRSL